MRFLVTVLGEHEWQLGQAGELQGADDNGITTLYACAVRWRPTRSRRLEHRFKVLYCRYFCFQSRREVMSLNLDKAGITIPPSRNFCNTANNGRWLLDDKRHVRSSGHHPPLDALFTRCLRALTLDSGFDVTFASSSPQYQPLGLLSLLCYPNTGPTTLGASVA